MDISTKSGKACEVILLAGETPPNGNFETGSTAFRPSDGKAWIRHKTDWQEM